MNCSKEANLIVALVKDLWKNERCYGARKLAQTLTGEVTVPVLIRTDQYEEGKNHDADWWYGMCTELADKGHLSIKTKGQFRMLIPGKVPVPDTFVYSPPTNASGSSGSFKSSESSGPSGPSGSGTNESSRTTLKLYESGKTVAEIAAQRGLKESTIGEHLIREWTVDPDKIDCEAFGLTQEIHDEIVKATETTGVNKLTPIKEAVSDHITYSQIKCSLLIMETDS